MNQCCSRLQGKYKIQLKSHTTEREQQPVSQRQAYLLIVSCIEESIPDEDAMNLKGDVSF